MLDDSPINSYSQSTDCLTPTHEHNCDLSKLEKLILTLSSSLNIITKNVTTISDNMATKADLATLRSEMTSLESRFETSNVTLATEVKKHDQILQNNSQLRDVLAQRISDNNKLIEKSLAQQENLSNRIDGIVRTHCTNFDIYLT